MSLEAIPLPALFALLAFLLLLSAFFSGSETAMMSVNRYQVAHLAANGVRAAQRVLKLLRHSDRLISCILLGNNFTNIILTQLATYIGYRLYGDLGIAIATGALTLMIVLFAEVTPKILASHYATKISLNVSLLFFPLLALAAPLIWMSTLVSAFLLRCFGVDGNNIETVKPLTRAELRTLLNDSRQRISQEYQTMLLGILDLEKRTVEDIMIPRHEIQGINLNNDIGAISKQLFSGTYTRMPIYEGDINHMIGMLHTRSILPLKQQEKLSGETLKALAREPYYIPENTLLQTALLDFKRHKRRHGFIVDEYGDIQGLITLEDLLEEIVGEFTRDAASYDQEIQVQTDQSVIVDASCHVRDLNRALHWHLDEDGPKTLNGLIIEHMETIPEAGTGFLIQNYPFEIIKKGRNSIRTVKISPQLKQPEDTENHQRTA